MLEQQRDHLLGGAVVFGIQTELGESLVLPHQLCRRDAEQAQDALECGAAERLLEVFDGVELDASLAEDLDRSARLASTRVVIDREHRRVTRFAEIRAVSTQVYHLSSPERASKIVNRER